MESGIIKIAHKMICRCVGMADEGDSKSLVLITRVGSTPTTGIKKKLPSLSGEFSFLSAACERVEQHGPALQGERSALLTLRDGEQVGIEGEAAPCHHEARLSGTEQ